MVGRLEEFGQEVEERIASEQYLTLVPEYGGDRHQLGSAGIARRRSGRRSFGRPYWTPETIDYHRGGFRRGRHRGRAGAGYRWLIAVRIVAGGAIGIASFVAPLYISEIGPVDIRGKLVSISLVALTSGIVISYLID